MRPAPLSSLFLGDGGRRREPQGRWHWGVCPLPPAHIAPRDLWRRKVGLVLPGAPGYCTACVVLSAASKGLPPQMIVAKSIVTIPLETRGQAYCLNTYLEKCSFVLRAF